MTALDLLLETCAVEIERRAALPQARRSHREGAEAFSRAVAVAAPVERRPERLPVVSVIDELPATPLVEAVRDAADEIHWVASPRVDDEGVETALAPLNEVRTLDPVTAGLLVLRRGATYPLHSHPPQELYLPIADGGRWCFGGNPVFRALDADALAYNHPNDRHSITAGDQPLLALYVLWN